MNTRVESPLNTFASMLEVLRQHQAGLVSDGEAILSLQCTSIQVDCLIAHGRLPYNIHTKVILEDWDQHVQMLTERAQANAESDSGGTEMRDLELKVGFDSDRLLSRIEIVSPGEGNWEHFNSPTEDLNSFVFIGYGGENVLTLMLSPMQDSSMDIVGVHQMVDNPARVVQTRARSEDRVNMALSSLIRSIGL